MLSDFGEQGGTIYEKHIAKVNKSGGYMRDGNVSHYVKVGFGEKTNNRGNCGKNYNPSIRDRKANIIAQQQEEELNSEQ